MYYAGQLSAYGVFLEKNIIRVLIDDRSIVTFITDLIINCEIAADSLHYDRCG